MKVVTMTEFNQRVSAVTRHVLETGEAVTVTNRGRAVLRLTPEPEPTGRSLESLISQGLASPSRRPHRPIGTRKRIALSRDLDDILTEVNDDARI